MTVCAVLFEIRFATYEKKSNDLIDTFVGIQNTMKNTQIIRKNCNINSMKYLI